MGGRVLPMPTKVELLLLYRPSAGALIFQVQCSTHSFAGMYCCLPAATLYASMRQISISRAYSYSCISLFAPGCLSARLQWQRHDNETRHKQHREASTRFMKETRQLHLKDARMQRDGERMQWQVWQLCNRVTKVA